MSTPTLKDFEVLFSAEEIAQRGPMPLFLADIALYRARFFHERDALAEARRLIDKHGYGRRLEEIEALEEASKAWSDEAPKEVNLMPDKKRFRVALSFPGEKRAFVERVAAKLAQHVGRERVLYDAYYEAEFSRTDLDVYLQRLYRDESELIVVFLCADYEKKDWCRLEWRAVRDVIKTRRDDAAVMPIRFDMTEIPGLFSNDGYLWVGDRQPEEIAHKILERLGSPVPTVLPSKQDSPKAKAPSAALKLWQEKLDFLLEQEPITVDANARFSLQVSIDEAREKIREHGGEL